MEKKNDLFMIFIQYATYFEKNGYNGVLLLMT